MGIRDAHRRRVAVRLVLAAGGAALWLHTSPAAAFGPDPTTAAARFRFVVLNDLHIDSDDLGVSRAQISRAVDEINTFAGQIAFVIVAGDLAQSGTAAALQTELQAAKDELDRLTVPYHVTIGNHDVTTTGDDTAFGALFGATSYRFEHDGMHFLALRTAQTQTSTTIPLEALDSLTVQLTAIDPAQPLVVFAHHPLGPLSPLRATNASAFYSRVDGHNLKAVLAGHFHGVFEEQRNGAWYCTSSAMAAHRANHDDTHEKGYRLVTVQPDWSLASRFYAVGLPPTFAPQPPVLQLSGNRYAMPGRPLTLTIGVREIDGDVVTVASSGRPPGATFNAAQRRLSWTPSTSQVGLHTGITFTATDVDGSDVESMAIRVVGSACVFDDFAPQQPGWTSWGGSWTVAAGELQQTLTTGGSHYSLAAGTWSDFHFEADVRQDEGIGYAGVVFRYVGPNDNYYLWNDGARVQLRRRVGGVVTQLGSSQPVGAIVGWHHVRVEARGSNLKVYWDGTLTLDVEDATFTSGLVGVLCSQAGARFDNVVVVGCPTLPNAAPVLQPIGDRTVYAGVPVQIDLAVADLEAGALATSATGLPAGATFNAGLRRMTWTPSPAQVNQRHTVRFRVSDGELDDAETVRFAVLDLAQTCTHETFTSGASAWAPGAGTWTVENGVYRGVSGSAAVTALSTHVGAPIGDFMLDARVRAEGSGVGGIAFRTVDATHTYAVVLVPSGDTIELRRVDGATSTKLAANAEVTDDVEEWRWLRVQAQGARVRVWLDGDLFYDYLDVGAAGRIWAAGSIGAIAVNASVFVDEIAVTSCTSTATDASEPATPTPLHALVAAPNPFNPRTTVRFALARAGHVEVVIYNASGQRVRQLFDGALGAGAHAMVWDGGDDRGYKLASGVYFLRATSASSIAMQRLVLVK
jgi:hypothetical protein